MLRFRRRVKVWILLIRLGVVERVLFMGAIRFVGVISLVVRSFEELF